MSNLKQLLIKKEKLKNEISKIDETISKTINLDSKYHLDDSKYHLDEDNACLQFWFWKNEIEETDFLEVDLLKKMNNLKSQQKEDDQYWSKIYLKFSNNTITILDDPITEISIDLNNLKKMIFIYENHFCGND